MNFEFRTKVMSLANLSRTFTYVCVLFSYILIIDNTYNVDWDVIDIIQFIETDIPTTKQKISNFYEDYLQMSSIISPWYRNILPLEVIYIRKQFNIFKTNTDYCYS